MNKIYLFAIAAILATASLMVTGTFTSTVFSQIPTTSGTDLPKILDQECYQTAPLLTQRRVTQQLADTEISITPM